MASEAQASEHAFSRGERRLTLAEYIGLVASCQAAFDAAMAELSPLRQVDLWNAFHPETFLPSSGKRMLWVLRRGVLDDLAPRATSVLARAWQPEPTEDEQLVFRAVLEALATGRTRPNEIIEFCNEIHPWPSVLGVAGYLTGNLAAAVRVATLEVASERQRRRVTLPSWALVGTLLEALDAAPWQQDATLVAFTAALATVLGPEKGQLTGEHARLLVQLYLATDAGRRSSALEPALRASLEGARQSTGRGDAVGDSFHELVQELHGLQLIRIGEEQEIRWTALTLVHLPPGQAAGELSSSPFKWRSPPAAGG
ncbi:MAG: hypothetical protein EOP82_30250 [Variovorax sp.]|nr:MAG: hypothetical protein EOP82_30250 [Variovorax sp.]